MEKRGLPKTVSSAGSLSLSPTILVPTQVYMPAEDPHTEDKNKSVLARHEGVHSSIPALGKGDRVRSISVSSRPAWSIK